MGIIYGKKIGAGIGYGGDPPMSVVDGSLNAFVSEQGTSSPTITIQWANPEDENWAGTLIVRKSGDIPASVNDGVQVYDGVNNSCTDTGEYGETYYYRAFTYNERRKYNTKSVSCSILPIAEISGEDLNVGAKIRFQYNGMDANLVVVQIGRPTSDYDESCDGIWCRIERAFGDSAIMNASGYSITEYRNTRMHKTELPDRFNKISEQLKNKIKTIKILDGFGFSIQSIETNLFLLSSKEMGLSGVSEPKGTVTLDYYKSGDTSRCVVYDELGTSPVEYWTRTIGSSIPNGQQQSSCLVNTSGNISTAYVTASKKVVFCFIIPKDTKFSANPNEDGSYNLM